jgi:hypothetical protein
VRDELGCILVIVTRVNTDMRSHPLMTTLALALLLFGCPLDDPDDDDIAGDDDAAPIDADADGSPKRDDCDDNDPQTWPGAPELCDGVDNDCDGVVPEDEEDEDADTFLACEDCDDNDDTSYPGALELCDGLDNDCDGVVPGDEEDGDADTYLACEDCDDNDETAYPGAPELCDGHDNDCDGVVPEDEVDGDGDGSEACEDCDDSNADVHPGAIEVACDDIDNDCDGSQHGDDVDDDGDGFDECGGDCDDGYETAFPGAAEICDGLDNDCDGVGDTGLCGTFDLSLANAKFVGEVDVDWAGYSVSSAGDVNSDGYDDVFIGAPGQDSSGWLAGAAYLVLGPVSGTVDLSAADAKLVGETYHNNAGNSISTAGDVNGDGYDDILVGAAYEDTGGNDAGAAYLVLSPVTGTVDLAAADGKLVGEADEDYAGFSVSSAGDVNGDGYDDLFVGATGQDAGGNNAGAAYLVLSPVVGTVDLSAAAAKLVGVSFNDYTGYSVSTAGDVNGDGYGDLIVGAPEWLTGAVRPGAAYLVFGPVTGTVNLAAADATFEGTAADQRAGCSVSSAGDVNDDGYDDLLVGAEFAGANSKGEAYLVLGPVTGNMNLLSADATFTGETNSDYAGYSVSSAGDVNGDGYDDIFVGAHSQDEGGSSAGAAYLVLGPASGRITLANANAKFVGEVAGDWVGYRTSVSAAGDVNGDGYDDLLVGAPFHDAGGSDAGAAYLMLGGP